MEQNKIKITNSAEVCHIDIEGTIGVPEEWQFEQPASRVATYEKFRDTVALIAGIKSPEVIVEIRSTGGDVNDALLIYDALKGLDAHIVTRCYGYTASAATIIAQAASQGCRMISPNALYLIHRSMCAVEGNADEIEARVELLRKTDVRLAELYAARAGRSAEEFEALMSENNGQGRWLSPDEAIAAGLADTVAGEADAAEAAEAAKAADDADTADAADAADGAAKAAKAAEKADDAEGSRSAKASAKVARTPKEFFSRNWKRLTAVLGGRHTDTPPSPAEDINVLHFGPVKAQTQSDVALSIAFMEGQRRAAPSATRAVEDPSTADMRRTANQQAYAADARNIAQSF